MTLEQQVLPKKVGSSVSCMYFPLPPAAPESPTMSTTPGMKGINLRKINSLYVTPYLQPPSTISPVTQGPFVAALTKLVFVNILS